MGLKRRNLGGPLGSPNPKMRLAFAPKTTGLKLQSWTVLRLDCGRAGDKSSLANHSGLKLYVFQKIPSPLGCSGQRQNRRIGMDDVSCRSVCQVHPGVPADLSRVRSCCYTNWALLLGHIARIQQADSSADILLIWPSASSQPIVLCCHLHPNIFTSYFITNEFLPPYKKAESFLQVQVTPCPSHAM